MREISGTSATIACRGLPTLEGQLMLPSAQIIPGNVVLQIRPRIECSPGVFTRLREIRLRVTRSKKEKKMSKHHSHEISEHPEIQWALDLLKPDPNHEPNVLSKYSAEIICVTSGFAIPSLANAYIGKPFYASECLLIFSHVIVNTKFVISYTFCNLT